MEGSSTNISSNGRTSTTNQDTEVLFYCLIGATSLLSNILIFVVIACDNTLRTKTNFLLVNLALSGCLVILIGIPIQVINLREDASKVELAIATSTTFACELQGVCTLVTYLVSIFNLVLIAIHRYVLVVKNAFYAKLFTWKRLVASIIFIWLLAVMTCLPPTFGWGLYVYSKDHGHCMVDWSHSTGYVMSIHMLSYLLPLLVMVFCYQQLLSHTLASSRRISDHDHTTQVNNNSSMKRSSSEVRLILMLVLVVFCFFVSFLPYCISMVIKGYMHMQSPKALSFAAMLFVYANGIFNFWIYAIMDTKFRKGLVGLWKRRLQCCIMGTAATKDDQCMRFLSEIKNKKNIHVFV